MGTRVSVAIMAMSCAAAWCWAREVRADKFDRTLDVSAQVAGGLFEPESIKLKPTGDVPPAVLGSAPMETRTWGMLMTGGARVGMTLRHLRFGVGVAAGSVEGLRWLHAGATVAEGRTFAMPLEAWVGYSACCGRQFRPYLDLRLSSTYLAVRERLVDRGGQELGSTFYSGSGLSLAPRLGVRGLLSSYWFADLGACIGVVGPETLLITLSVGLPIPTANL